MSLRFDDYGHALTFFDDVPADRTRVVSAAGACS